MEITVYRVMDATKEGELCIVEIVAKKLRME